MGPVEFVGLGIVLLFVLSILASAIKIAREYERIVVFRLGRLIGVRGPGLVLRVPFIDSIITIDLRTYTFDVPKQRIVTKDNVTVEVDAVVYYHVVDPAKAVTRVRNYIVATNLLAQSILRDVVGQEELDSLLSKREELNKRLTSLLDVATDPWGIKVTAVTIKDVVLPESMLRAMAMQAEAERQRRARIIMAEGEFQAAKKMAEAAEMYAKNPIAMRLRELQTYVEIAKEKNLIIIMPAELGHVGTAVALAKGLKAE